MAAEVFKMNVFIIACHKRQNKLRAAVSCYSLSPLLFIGYLQSSSIKKSAVLAVSMHIKR